MSGLRSSLLAAAATFLLFKAFEKKKSAPIRSIYLLGDSQTAQPRYKLADTKFFDDESTWFRTAVENKVSIPVYVGARGGWGVRKARQYFMPHIKQVQPDVVVAWLGVNDLSSGRSPDHIISELKQLKEDVKPSRLVLLDITPWAGYSRGRDKVELTRITNQRMKNEVGVPVISMAQFGDAQGRLKPEYTSDNLHLDRPSKSAAYEVLADTLVDFLMSL